MLHAQSVILPQHSLRLENLLLGKHPCPRAAAIKLIDEDNELSDHEQLQIFKVIRKDVSVADLVLAMRDKGKRTRYIQSELNDLFF